MSAPEATAAERDVSSSPQPKENNTTSSSSTSGIAPAVSSPSPVGNVHGTENVVAHADTSGSGATAPSAMGTGSSSSVVGVTVAPEADTASNAGNAPITRAEFAAICARFDYSIDSSLGTFSDVIGHWAEEETDRAASLGWITGYEDGTFHPDQYITRAEAMTIINRVLHRLPETKDDLHEDMTVWPDNADPAAWYYLAVHEATNSHDFARKTDDLHERWTRLTTAPDWTRYEK